MPLFTVDEILPRRAVPMTYVRTFAPRIESFDTGNTRKPIQLPASPRILGNTDREFWLHTAPKVAVAPFPKSSNKLCYQPSPLS